jgi:hypothetical protein
LSIICFPDHFFGTSILLECCSIGALPNFTSSKEGEAAVAVNERNESPYDMILD